MSMHSRIGLALTVALAAILLVVAPAAAWEPRVEGLPTPVADPVAYLIGHDADGWHLLTSGPGPQHHFTGVLSTNGRFTDVRLRRPEASEAVRVTNGGRELRFSFHTWDGVDGVDFRVEGGSQVTFALHVDGRLIPATQIYLGARGVHPPNNPFTVRR